MDNLLQEILTAFDAKTEQLSGRDTMEAALDRKGVHNHVRIEHDFMNSQFFAERLPLLVEECNQFFEGVSVHDMGDKINEYNQMIGSQYNEIREAQKDLEEFGLDQMKIFIELFAKHYGASYIVEHHSFRFPVDRTGDFHRQEIIKAYNYMFYPEQHEICYFQETLAAVWTLIHVGLGHYALSMMRRIDEEYVNFFETGKTIYPFLDYEPHWARFGQSSDWASAWIHRQMGNNHLYAEKLNSIINRHPLYSTDDRFTVFWHTGVARLLEAAVCLYEIQPTEETKQKLNDIFKYNHQMECQEHTESLREMLMAIYSYANKVYNYAN